MGKNLCKMVDKTVIFIGQNAGGDCPHQPY